MVKRRFGGRLDQVRFDGLFLDFRTGFEHRLCVHDALSSSKLLVGKETSASPTHLYQQLSVDITIVVEEKHANSFAVGSIGVIINFDIIYKRFSFLGYSVECQGRIQQPVNALAFALKIDAEHRYKHQIALSRLYQNCPRYISAITVRPIYRDVVLSYHGAFVEPSTLDILHVGDTSAQKVFFHGQHHAASISVDYTVLRAEHVANFSFCKLQQIHVIKNNGAASLLVLLSLHQLIVTVRYHLFSACLLTIIIH